MRAPRQTRSAVVDELHPLVIRCCGLALRSAPTCVVGSQQFSSVHAVSGAHVPSVCPASGRTEAHGSGGCRSVVRVLEDRAVELRFGPCPVHGHLLGTEYCQDHDKNNDDTADHGYGFHPRTSSSTAVSPGGMSLRLWLQSRADTPVLLITTRFAARRWGLPFGLVLAVRSAGSAKAFQAKRDFA